MAEQESGQPYALSRKGKTGLRRLWNALWYSLAGLASAYRNESAFRQEVAVAAVLLPVALLLPVTVTHKALLCASLLLVLVVELLNSGIEAVVDRVSLQAHELAKRAKDMGSAAVLLSIGICVLVWLLVLLEAFGS